MYDRQRETRCDINPEYEEPTDVFGKQSRTRDYVGGAEGFDAQDKAMQPGGAADKSKQPGAAEGKADVKAGADAKADQKAAAAESKDAQKPSAGESKGDIAATKGDADAAQKKAADTKVDVAAGAEQKGEAPAGAADLSPIRQALLKQYQALDGKGVGDAEFDAICSKGSWDDRQIAEKKSADEYPAKLAEWQAKCAEDPTWSKTHKQPTKLSHYTTCIDTQAYVLRAAFEAEKLSIKTTGDARFYFGPDAAEKGKKLDAWTPGSPGMGARPKPGDILVLQMQGAKLDQANAGMGKGEADFKKSEDELTKKIADLGTASAAAEEGAAAAQTKKATDLADQLSKLRQKHDESKAKLQKTLDDLHAKYEKGGDTGDKHHWFSHVANFVGWREELKDGQPTGKEIWTTFDGGQMVWGKVGNQGSKKSERFYHKATNEISGEATQGGDTRFLQGWIDVDKMVQSEQPQKK